MDKDFRFALGAGIVLAFAAKFACAQFEDPCVKNHYILTGPGECITPAAPASTVKSANSWMPIGPDGSNVVAIVIDPNSPASAFAGTLGAGILKTADAGTTWTTLNSGLPTLNVTALAIDPTMSSTLYAGTDAGLFKTIDGGQSWKAANEGLEGAPQIMVNSLAIDPNAPTTIYVATRHGVSKTTNGGAGWTPVNAGLAGLTPRLVTVVPTLPSSTIYVVVDDFYEVAQGIFKSTDGGSNWQRIYTADCAEPYCEGPTVTAFVVDPRAPSRLFAAHTNDARSGSLARSSDGGATWSHIRTPGWYALSLEIDRTSFETIYAGTYSGAVFRSSDAGFSWTLMTEAKIGSVNLIVTDAAAPGVIYAGGTTGTLASANRGQTWIRPTLGVRNVAAFATVAPLMPSTMYAQNALGGHSVMKTVDGGSHWTEAFSGMDLRGIDPLTPSTLYASTSAQFAPGSDLFKSTDAGASWTLVLKSDRLTSLAIAQSDPSILYVADFGGLRKSTDGGGSWKPLSTGLAAGAPYSVLSVAPTNADTVYVVPPLFGGTVDMNGKIFKSTDGGEHWQQLSIGLSVEVSISSIRIHPTTPSTIYVTYSRRVRPGGGIVKSTDGGVTWISADSGLFIGYEGRVTMAIDPRSAVRLYAATDFGVFRSLDGGASWLPMDDGLSNLLMYGLAIDGTGTLLRAAGAGGLSEYRLSPVTPGTIPVVEYFHEAFRHYFLTASTAEIAALDHGDVAGWTRTGYQFNAYSPGDERANQVCRFFSTAFGLKSSHFYTPYPGECALVQANPDWQLESADVFRIDLPAADGPCAAGAIPVYRMYNNGQGGAPNHRFTTDPGVRAQMLAQGWVAEGVGAGPSMCSPP